MVLSRKAVADFLARPLRDSDKAKRFSERALDAKIRKLGLETHTSPRLAQKVCLLLGWKYPRYQMLLGLGGGKTKVALDLFVNHKIRDQAERLLVLVPNTVNLGEWENEARKHAPDCSVCAIDVVGTENRRNDVLGDADIIVVTFNSALRLCSKKATKGKKAWTLDKSKVREIGRAFGMLVVDESTEIKNHSSLYFRMVRALLKHITYYNGLTGLPFNTPEDLWSQFYVVDGGHALGETLGMYRAVFYRKEQGHWAPVWTFQHKKKHDLARRLRHCSVRFKESECQDLPDAVGGLAGDNFMLLPSTLPKEQKPYYDALSKQLESIEYGHVTAIKNSYTRMRMVTSGWLGAVDSDGERVEFRFKKNPKLDAVLAKLGELDPDEKVIVVHWFNTSGDIVSDRLGQEHLRVYGKTPIKKKRKVLDQFRDPKGPRILLASTAISKGVNLQAAARYMIFFESPDSPIERNQMEGRTRREGGLPGSRYYYDAACMDTKDVAILDALRSGQRLLDVIVDEKRKKR